MYRFVILFILAFAPLYAMNGLYEIGVGVKSKGMGGVGVALPQDSFAIALNPAGMATQGNRFDLGTSWIWPSGSTRIEETGQRFRNRQVLWFPEAALAWEFCPCQVISIATWINGSLHLQYPGAIPSLGTNPVTFNFSQIALAASWAWRINPIHSVGIAVNIYIAWLQAQGVENFIPNSVSPDDLSLIGVGLGFEPGCSLQIGWIGQLTPCFRLGVSLQSRSWFCRTYRFQGLFPRGGNIDLPPAASIGIAYTFLPYWTAALDFVYRPWRSVPTFGHTSDQNGTFLTGFGAWNGPGFGWKNQTLIKLGVAWTPKPCLTLRTGYNYGNCPIPRAETLLNQLTLATQEHHLTLGITYRWFCHELSLYGYSAFPHRVNGFNSPAGTIDLSNRQLSAGIAYGHKF